MQPAYDFSAVPQPVVLRRGRARIVVAQKAYEGDCEVQLRLLPKPQIVFVGFFASLAAPALFATGLDSSGSSFYLDGQCIAGFAAQTTVTHEVVMVAWRPASEPVLLADSDAKQMHRAVFHLFNFWDLIPNQRSVVLRDDRWAVSLQTLNGGRDAIKQVRAEGGCLPTHIAEFKRRGEQLFSGRDAREQLRFLFYFLTFVRGDWCDPACAVGFDTDKQIVWEAWSSPRVASYSATSWFDPHHIEQLEALYPLFRARWDSSEAWQDTLTGVVYWYASAATPGAPNIDAGIILCQAALERLAYQYCVIDRCLVSREGFGRLRAADRFRMMFSSLGLPLAIPAGLAPLAGMANQLRWEDGPHALVELRNGLVHPERKGKGQLGKCYDDGWRLGLWYLELSLLASCGYSGTYANRLTREYVGQVEIVPWATPPV